MLVILLCTFNIYVFVVQCKEDLTQPQIDEVKELSFSLIGTTEDRKLLREKQDEEYQKTLAADNMKTADRKLKEQLQDARRARVVPEPSTSNFVTVKIRHPSLGIVSRRLPFDSKMYAVYDWAGSLSIDPAHFILTDPSTGNTLQPSSPVHDKRTLNMVESLDGTPSLLESDDEVQFLGFGQVFPNR